MNTPITGMNRRDTADELGIDKATLRAWTAKGVIAAKTWTSPGGRVYVGYAEREVSRVRALLT